MRPIVSTILPIAGLSIMILALGSQPMAQHFGVPYDSMVDIINNVIFGIVVLMFVLVISTRIYERRR